MPIVSLLGRSFFSSASNIQHTLLKARFFGSAAASNYDVAIIGGGPAGYAAAIKASHLGLKVTCIEGRGTLGGTCLNVGCIPSKAILNMSHKYHEARKDFPDMGIQISDCSMNIATMMKRKDKAVKGLTQGIEMLFKKNKVDYIKGFAKFLSPSTLSVNLNDGHGEKQIEAKNIIIATGSEPSPFPGGAIVADEKVVVTSTGALLLSKVPSKLLVIGGGVIGLELGSVWGRLGAEVNVVEYMDHICGNMDLEVSKAFQKILEKQGLKFHLSTKVLSADIRSDSATVHMESVKDQKALSMDADVILLAVGRKPFTANLGLEAIGVQLDKMGRIPVNHEFQIESHPSIRAVGDVIAGPMLAHKAEDEGIAVAELISGKGVGHVNYDAIPNVIYTHPEVAGVGASEEELKQKNISYAKGTFPLAANSRARTNLDSEGYVKVLTHAKDDRILGGWIIGANAGELISELVLGIEYGASSEDIARTCHAHPTLSEAVREACMAAHFKAIHSV